MVKQYIEKERDSFALEEFQNQAPDCSESFISKALELLKTENYVSILRAEGVALFTALTAEGIKFSQSNTFLKKTHETIKELRSLI